MVVGLKTLAATAATTLVTVYLLGRETAGSDFGTHEQRMVIEHQKEFRKLEKI